MRTNRKKTIRIAVLILILLLGIGFAALKTTLKIDGTVNVDKTTWDVHFENVQPTTGSVEANPAPTTNNIDTTEMTYTIGFTKPGDFYEFTVDIVNNGTIDAMIEDVSNNAYANAQSTTPITLPSYLTSTVTYSDGVPIQQNQILPKKNGNTKTVEKVKVRIEFKKDISVNDLPSDGDTTIVFKFIGDYKQADEYSIPVRNVCSNNENVTTLSTGICTANENVTIPSGTICKRAIDLHQEKCNQTSSTQACSAAGYTKNGSKGTTTITYGNCGTQGSSPVSGDAFTCDVNGDGIFDELTERFYYISDYYDTTNKTFDTSTAVLIYYNNIASGVSCNKKTYAYDSNWSNWNGPVTLISQLPSTMQWSNIVLKSNTRAILGEYSSTHDSPTTSGGTLPTDFSYSGYAARFLTAKELMTGCGLSQIGSANSGELDGCTYLFENTKYSKSSLGSYGHWLETPDATNAHNVLYIAGTRRSVTYDSADTSSLHGARPVIEVSKTKISY